MKITALRIIQDYKPANSPPHQSTRPCTATLKSFSYSLLQCEELSLQPSFHSASLTEPSASIWGSIGQWPFKLPGYIFHPLDRLPVHGLEMDVKDLSLVKILLKVAFVSLFPSTLLFDTEQHLPFMLGWMQLKVFVSANKVICSSVQVYNSIEIK